MAVGNNFRHKSIQQIIIKTYCNCIENKRNMLKFDVINVVLLKIIAKPDMNINEKDLSLQIVFFKSLRYV